ncbi:hypothetical protein F5Y00DRAFT_163737 [Daldinia vernicosa]|uniref:uncharacterized protein n=1 Tax=Daldinia vernicosa TaxID=114800 RepID=UPI0020077494|nr:uncharacterized protein F5Y00DRAFT_163737 [Daldinia vernicosa]KAI0845664.1 hypothetical protein F5Y00DRAFT_163737 [Daldinia vernicosa]
MSNLSNTMLTPTPNSIRALQAISIALLTTTAGASASLSIFLVPRLMESPTPLMVGQFLRAVSSARRRLTIPLILPGILHAYLAYLVPVKARMYVIAATLTLSTLPWTHFAITPLNRELEGRIMTLDAEEFETAHQLVDSWATRNLYKPVVNFAAGIIGLYAALW